VHLVSNSANETYLAEVIANVARLDLMRIRAAVAYARWIDPLVTLARDAKAPFALFTLIDGDFPAPAIIDRFLNAPIGWELRLTRDYFHAKVIWLEGVGAYVGSANLTEKAWWQNVECGVWFDQADLDGEPMGLELSEFFRHLEDGGRFVRAQREHLDALRKLAAQSRLVDQMQAELVRQTSAALAGVPGAAPPKRDSNVDSRDQTRIAFVLEWDNSLTLLRKLAAKVREVEWPAWVDRNQDPAIVQDQVTEYWWDTHCRRSSEGSAEMMMLVYHDRHAHNPEAAVDEMITEWTRFVGSEKWRAFLNVAPIENRALLTPQAIAVMGKTELTQIITNTHAAREHSRQMLKSELGDEGKISTQEERCALFADYLLAATTAMKGRGVREVLQYVIWGDKVEASVAERIWRGAFDPAWKLRHLGLSILGELVGYARPDKYPPRNTRVSKTLTALGFSGIRI
jgi:hypothetical protein